MPTKDKSLASILGRGVRQGYHSTILLLTLFMPTTVLAGNLLSQCTDLMKQRECVKKIETKQLSKHKGLVWRDGNTLNIQTLSGVIKRTNSPADIEGFSDEDGHINAKYYFQEVLEDKNSAVLTRLLWEGSDYEVVSLETGESIILPNDPFASPNGNTYISFYTDDYEPYTFGFGLWTITSKEVKQIFDVRFDYGFELVPQWVDDSNINLYKGVDIQGVMETKFKVGVLTKKNKSWSYENLYHPQQSPH